MTYGQEISANLSDYVGEWVIIVDKKVVQHGENLKRIFKEVKERYPTQKLLVGKGPRKWEFNLIMTFYFRYKQIDKVARPIVIFSIKGIDFFGLIDSGADSSFMPRDVAEILGIDVEKLEDDEIRGISGEIIKVKKGFIDVTFKDNREAKNIQHVPFHIDINNKLKYFVIGRAGIFDNFTVTFEQAYKRVGLKYNPKKVYEK